MKKRVYVVLFFMMLLCFVGCGKKESSVFKEEKDVTTVKDNEFVFPDILGEDEEKAISLLEKQGYYVEERLHNDDPEEFYSNFALCLPKRFQEIMFSPVDWDNSAIIILNIITAEDKVIGAWGLIKPSEDYIIDTEDFLDLFKISKKEKLKSQMPVVGEYLGTTESGEKYDSRFCERLVFDIKNGELQICTHRFFLPKEKMDTATWKETRPDEFMLLDESMLQPEYEMSEEERKEIIENEDQYAGYYVAEDGSYIMIYQEETDYYVEMNILNSVFVYGTGKLSDNQMIVEAIDEQSGETIRIVFDYRFEQELITMRVESSQLESLPSGREMDFINDAGFSTVPSL